jgi:hypothetical protein
MKILIVDLSDHVEVRVIDDQGMTIRKFTYRDLLAARRAAEAWSVAYGDCKIVDLKQRKR